MARRRNSILDAIEAFNAAYDMTTKVGSDFELSRLAQAQPEELQGYTAEQGADLKAAAARGDKVDIKYKDDGQGNQVFDRYVVTPAQGSAANDFMPQSRDVATQGVTDFLGKRTAGQMSPEQADRARMVAMTGVISKTDPMKAMAMRQSMAQQDRQAKLDEQQNEIFNRQKIKWDQEDEDRNREVIYRAKRDLLLKESPLGQYQAATAAANAKFEQDTAVYNEGVKAGKTPQELGLPPQKPNIPRPGPMQTMAGYANLMMLDYEHGKLNTDGLIQFQEKFQNLEKENYTKALLAAQNGGTPEQIAKAFNSAGMQIDPKNVTITRTKQANGPDQVMLGYTDEKGQTVNINVMAELEGYDKAKQVFDRFYKSEDNRRGNNSDGRAAAAVTREQAEKKARAEAAVNYYKEKNPNATPAELDAVRNGVIDITPDTKNAPSEVKLAQAMVNAGLAPDMRAGLEMAITKKTQDPGEMHKGFVEAGIKNMAKPEDAVASADKVMETMGYRKNNGRWSLPKGQAPAGDGQAAPKLTMGQVVDGFEYLGGDPKDPKSWREKK